MSETNELLIIMHKNLKMGKTSTRKLISLIKDKDNKIKFLLEEILQRYEVLYKKCKKLMKKEKIDANPKGIIANLTSSAAMAIEVTKDNSDSKIASIMIRGFSMGNTQIEAKIKDYKKEAKSEVIVLAKDLLSFGEKQIKLLKDFL